MEICVEEYFDFVTKEMDICTCDKCKLDIMALALNNLTPKYVVSDRGELFAKTSAFTQQSSTDVIIAITNASKKVSTKPNH